MLFLCFNWAYFIDIYFSDIEEELSLSLRLILSFPLTASPIFTCLVLERDPKLDFEVF